jgi:tyrosyl-tRNA synthetase
MDLYGELEWRGLVYDVTDGLRGELARGPVTVYAGFDPTAPSLHVGHMLPVLALSRFQRGGHSPIALVGGGTGLIGDPSFKAAERALLTIEEVEANVERIRGQLARFLDFDSTSAAARLIDNAEWLTKLGAIEFMRDVGKHFSVNAMMAKESVKRRVTSEEGISYTEFSYPLLQSYDFLVLYDRFNCTVQIGGSDQWGNITSGMDLIRRVRGGKAHGLVLPLLMTAAGTKFGKTEAGSVWLDANLTSPFTFYQFWLNVDDKDAGSYLKYFTFLDASTIHELAASTAASPERREAQRELAREVTRLVHGREQVERVERASMVLFDGDLHKLPIEDVLAVFADAPSTELAAQEFAGPGLPMVDLLARIQLTPSKSEARRLIQSGGVYVNNQRVTDLQTRLTSGEALGGRLFVVRKGQREQRLVKLI